MAPPRLRRLPPRTSGRSPTHILPPPLPHKRHHFGCRRAIRTHTCAPPFAPTMSEVNMAAAAAVANHALKAQCTGAGQTMDNKMQAYVVLNQAGLMDLQKSLVISTARTGVDGSLQCTAVVSTLMLLFPTKGRLTGTTLMTQEEHQPTGSRPGPSRSNGGAGGVSQTTGGVATCWYCSMNGHVKNDCRLRAKHLKERGIVRPADQPATAVDSGAEVIHLAVLAGMTGMAWDAPVDQIILDPGAMATVAGEAWVTAFLAALPPGERAGVVRSPTDVRFKFGNSEHVTAAEQIVVPLRFGSTRYRVRVFVLPGALPLFVSRPTVTSMGAVIDFKRHALSIDGRALRLDISPVGYCTLDGLGMWGVHRLADAALLAIGAPANPTAGGTTFSSRSEVLSPASPIGSPTPRVNADAIA